MPRGLKTGTFMTQSNDDSRFPIRWTPRTAGYCDGRIRGDRFAEFSRCPNREPHRIDRTDPTPGRRSAPHDAGGEPDGVCTAGRDTRAGDRTDIRPGRDFGGLGWPAMARPAERPKGTD